MNDAFDEELTLDDPAEMAGQVTQPWKVLIVDDEPQIHEVSALVLGGLRFQGRDLQLLNAHDSKQARELLSEHDDIALILLDVVMDSDDAGLRLVRYIREELRNEHCRIILRTGQPGHAPEHKVILEYDISDYKEKTELTSQKLSTAVIAGLRGYQALADLASLNRSLDIKVKMRTVEVSAANERLQAANRALADSNRALKTQVDERLRAERVLQERNAELVELTRSLETAQVQVVQSERMASVGQLAAGVAHEINNPIAFVQSNLNSLNAYVEDLLALITRYEASETLVAATDAGAAESLAAERARIGLEFLREEVSALLGETLDGVRRIKRIVKGLNDFSHVGDSEWRSVDIHAGLDSSLDIAAHDIRYKAELVRHYGKVPPVDCVPHLLNQVFLSLLVNAGQAIESSGVITVRTRADEEAVQISISDTGCGISDADLPRVFDPFFTTKPVGQGTGLGLSIAYGIVKRHGGWLEVQSELDVGTTMTIHLPLRRSVP